MKQQEEGKGERRPITMGEGTRKGTTGMFHCPRKARQF